MTKVLTSGSETGIWDSQKEGLLLSEEKPIGRRTKKPVSITIPERLLDVMDAERRPKESRSQQIVRLTMKGLGLSAKEQLAIHENRE